MTTIIITGLLLAGCGSSDEPSAKKQTSDNVVLASETNPSRAVVDMPPQPADAPAIGTPVVDMIDTSSSTGKQSDAKDYKDVLWDDLLPPDFKPEKILERYQAQIQAAAEGSVEERILFDKVMGEFNSAGANKEMDDIRVRIPGYVAPLDTNGDMVGDFLLVPYYGSCIHSPPPPAHQTVMVNPQVGKSINLRETYRPVWVTGTIEIEDVETDLAKASYQIKNAVVIPYTQPKN